ncbi:MAG: hypothetical protein JSV09_13280 [Thermoplasmata archaeon]|nr:MAG: hypothetical protein JSV09_13280 [Thermoplasmata archaeon]
MKTKEKEIVEKKEDYSCKWNVEQEYREIRIIADCKECGGKGDLRQSYCLKGILEALSSESNADVAILSHYVERQYFGYSLELLKRMAQIMQELEQLAIRNPYGEYFSASSKLTASQKSQQKSACEKCQLNPKILFLNLKKIFATDILKFHETFIDYTKRLEKKPTPNCGPCLKTTKSDFVYLFNNLEDLRSFIFYRGFNIVI